MLATAPIIPVIPVTDLVVAKAFYKDILGLSVVRETSSGITLQAGGDAKVYLYKREHVDNDQTNAAFLVGDIEESMIELRNKGVEFSQVDTPTIKTNEKGIAVSEDEGQIVAWFQDPDGNYLVLSQVMK